jgi:amino acid transporter
MRLVKFIILAKLVPLILLILICWKEVQLDNLAIVANPSFLDIGKTSLILFFAFQGAEAALSISGEVKQPQKTIPKSILISIVSILILYILIQTVSQGVLGDTLSSFTENPLGAVANQVFGQAGFALITIGAAVSMFGYLSSAVLSMPRVLYSASKDRVLPFKPLAHIHRRYATPYVSVISYALLGFLFASLGGFEQLAIISSASILLVYLGVSLSVIKLRTLKFDKTQMTHFKIPGGYVVPILSSLTIIGLLSNLSYNEMIGISLFILALTLLYFLQVRLNKKQK